MIGALILASIAVSWTAAASQPAGFATTGFYIYRAMDGKPPARVASPTGLTWNDAGTKPGHRYCYQIATHGIVKIKGRAISGLLTSAPSTPPACVAVQ